MFPSHDQARQKQFQYTINFKPSNQPFGKWVPEFADDEVVSPTCDFTASTDRTSGIGSNAITFVGTFTSGSTQASEVGFVYSTTNSVPTIPADTNQKDPNAGSPVPNGEFDLNSGPVFSPSTLVYFRAYASSSACLTYGLVLSASTTA